MEQFGCGSDAGSSGKEQEEQVEPMMKYTLPKVCGKALNVVLVQVIIKSAARRSWIHQRLQRHIENAAPTACCA